MQSVVITGCNRGIGLSLVKQLIATHEFDKIIATCRNTNNAEKLVQLSQSHKELQIISIDLKEFNRYDELAKQVEEFTGNQGLNLLINNAGVSTKFTRIGQLKLEQLVENYVINTAAPLMLIKALLPLLRRASDQNKHLPICIKRAAVINISSVLGSIADNSDGGFYPYRCSKSALNAATKSLSIDLKNDNILVAAIHPGWCKTDMGGNNAPLQVDDATATLINTMRRLGQQENGSFLQYDGKRLQF